MNTALSFNSQAGYNVLRKVIDYKTAEEKGLIAKEDAKLVEQNIIPALSAAQDKLELSSLRDSQNNEKTAPLDTTGDWVNKMLKSVEQFNLIKKNTPEKLDKKDADYISTAFLIASGERSIEYDPEFPIFVAEAPPVNVKANNTPIEIDYSPTTQSATLDLSNLNTKELDRELDKAIAAFFDTPEEMNEAYKKTQIENKERNIQKLQKSINMNHFTAGLWSVVAALNLIPGLIGLSTPIPEECRLPEQTQPPQEQVQNQNDCTKTDHSSDYSKLGLSGLNGTLVALNLGIANSNKNKKKKLQEEIDQLKS